MSAVPKLLCENCQAASLCLPVGLDQAEFSSLDQLIKRRIQLERGEHLIQQGQAFNSYYAVREGAFKSYTVSRDGREQIWGFYFVGEMFGFVGADTDQFPYSVCALEPSIVCEISFSKLMQLTAKIPALQKQMLKLISHRFITDLSTPRNHSAEKRLASFLLSLSSRFKKSGQSSVDFRLPLTRQEMANYLGITIETTSRLLTRFSSQGVVEVRGKHFIIHDLRYLQKLAC